MCIPNEAKLIRHTCNSELRESEKAQHPLGLGRNTGGGKINKNTQDANETFTLVLYYDQ